MDEERSGFVRKHVVVDRRHLDAVLPQGGDQRIHLLSQSDEVSSDGRAASDNSGGVK